MSIRPFFLSLPLLALPHAAAAVELEALSAQDRQHYCYAYLSIALDLQRQAGVITSQQAGAEMSRISRIVMNRQGNVSVGTANARLDRAYQAIAAENPPPKVFAARVEACAKYLRL